MTTIDTSLDIATAHFLKDSFSKTNSSSGFMTAPIDMIQGKAIEVKSRKCKMTVENILEAKEFFANLNKENPAFLYNVKAQPPQIIYTKLDPETFEPIELDIPEMVEGFWIIRYATLNEEF